MLPYSLLAGWIVYKHNCAALQIVNFWPRQEIAEPHFCTALERLRSTLEARPSTHPLPLSPPPPTKTYTV